MEYGNSVFVVLEEGEEEAEVVDHAGVGFEGGVGGDYQVGEYVDFGYGVEESSPKSDACVSGAWSTPAFMVYIRRKGAVSCQTSSRILFCNVGMHFLWKIITPKGPVHL